MVKSSSNKNEKLVICECKDLLEPDAIRRKRRRDKERKHDKMQRIIESLIILHMTKKTQTT